MNTPQITHSTYYLALQGEQVGPLSEENILDRIEKGELARETLVWSEGMEEWAPLTALAVFEAAFRKKTVPSRVEKREDSVPSFHASPLQQPQGPRKPVSSYTPKTPEEEMTPVFGASESRMDDSPFVKKRIVMISVGLCLLAAATGTYFYFSSQSGAFKTASQLKLNKNKTLELRQRRLSKAQSEILIQTESAVQEMKKLIEENPNDPVAKQSSDSLLDYFRSTQKHVEAGRILFQNKSFVDAAKMFSHDPSAKKEAEEAYFQAFLSTADPLQKKSYLEQDIALLVGPLGMTEKAIERIRLFENTFPNQPHSYHYYLQTTDERIRDIFSRISFHFVQGLLSYFETEMGQITLLSRPLVEIKKTKTGEYHVVGTYRGEILLNQDRLKDIFFTFWIKGEQWILIDTNMTLERKRWAENERNKLKSTAVSGETMLRQLEQIFRTQFPKNGLHEKVEPIRETVKPLPDSSSP